LHERRVKVVVAYAVSVSARFGSGMLTDADLLRLTLRLGFFVWICVVLYVFLAVPLPSKQTSEAKGRAVTLASAAGPASSRDKSGRR